jgi:hypothetical protein
MLHSQAGDDAGFSEQDYGCAMTQTAGHQFFKELLRKCNAPPRGKLLCFKR